MRGKGWGAFGFGRASGWSRNRGRWQTELPRAVEGGYFHTALFTDCSELRRAGESIWITSKEPAGLLQTPACKGEQTIEFCGVACDSELRSPGKTGQPADLRALADPKSGMQGEYIKSARNSRFGCRKVRRARGSRLLSFAVLPVIPNSGVQGRRVSQRISENLRIRNPGCRGRAFGSLVKRRRGCCKLRRVGGERRLCRENGGFVCKLRGVGRELWIQKLVG